MPHNKSLVIVESPAKARTIAGLLGHGYVVESSIGHIRDLPKSAKDVPAEHKKESWARLGVDVDHGFKPLYVVDPDKRRQIARLKALLKESDILYLATDEDREGESIAWHLLEVLKPHVPVQRMVFHEITPRAIQEAIQKPRQVDRRLVDAQEARRILDRLYGYEVSPVLWKKVMPRLSAGRVQSVATRMVVEREWERMRFVRASYWDIEGTFRTQGAAAGELAAVLSEVGGKRVATGKDFSEQGLLRTDDATVLDEPRARQIAERLAGATFTVDSVARKPHRRSPSPPFMTSTLQQEASRKLRYAAARTMRAAQRLYEAGYITYMRTDSTTLSETALASARAQISRLYGPEYLPPSPRRYTKKVKNAQEAHEAIRPAGEDFRAPDQVAREVGPEEARLYELIWMRTVASQMQDARLEMVTVNLRGTSSDGVAVGFVAHGSTVLFPGFFRAYVEGSDDPAADLEQRERPIPPLQEGQSLEGRQFGPRPHETQPPARYTEASLVHRLEELGVGRPSTYAAIISTIQDRGYVWKKGTALVPSFTAFAVVELLKQHFGDLVDYEFTARMEDALDAIADGEEAAVPWLGRFYFGAGDGRAPGSPGRDKAMDLGLRGLVANRLQEIDARAINSFLLGKDDQDRDVLVRVGRHGAYLQRADDTASVPDDLEPDQLTMTKALELLQAPSGDRLLGHDPETRAAVLVRCGRFGPYVQLGEAPASKGSAKPKTASLLSSMSSDAVTLEQALQLLSLPRVVGTDPSDGQPVTAQLGRYGAYVSKGSQSRSLGSDDRVFTVTLDEALALLSKPQQRRSRAPAEPLRTLGTDPVSGGTITLREGRFGPYVTDGETNASLRKGDSPETIDSERAQELLQARRVRGPVQKVTKRPRRAAGTPVKSPKASSTTHADAGVPKKARAKSARSAATKPKRKTSSARAGSEKGSSRRRPSVVSPRSAQDDGQAVSTRVSDAPR
ncbi:MAG: type I DNA topoisomerase [Polyangiaceae bacterium]|nr:type I DNA topoisomerase [Polyangiaceae bacterium]